ncbi:hypothetical protein LSUB1_G003475 [Lachnellula subtilissima]|uniref:Zn(2)-C6 fungal-type domain-containing protein n=1 Tax=Lachnellula subtilissima TaxID=602034 RepID=A0A8H8RYN3_9HELO|nr:hypothetical protein LSUB1_G003475 [Lachnellula subtilissima]
MDDSQFFLDPLLCTKSADTIPFPGRRKQRERVRATRACIACRSRHMKCDSIEPVCTRCEFDARTCIYTKSRRGGSGQSLLPLEKLHGHTRRAPPPTATATSQGSNTSPQTSNSIFSDEGVRHTPSPSSEVTNVESTGRVETDQLLESYYDFFHDAHPVALPRKKLLSRMQNDPGTLELLIPVLEYIGAIYTPGVCTATFRQKAHEKLTASEIPFSGYSVQALALFAIAIHCSDEYKAAEYYLDRATDIALSIEMHREGFAVNNSECDPVLAESWRRTWWVLYGTDSLFAATSHYPTHRLRDTMGDVKLPGEDRDYESGKIPQPRSLADYDNREFDDEDVVYSSWTYLIDVSRITSSILSINHEERGPGDPTIATADARILNWSLYLPQSKQDLISKDQKIDETMFLAHTIIKCVKMLLHRPHSQLQYSDIETQSVCTPPSSLRQTRAVQKSIATHTAKCLEAIETSIMLFALPSPHIKHSPLVTCALALQVMAQVSACNYVLKEGSNIYEAGRDRIRLGLGALKAQVCAWGLAKRSVREVAGVARELLGIPTAVKAVGAKKDMSCDDMMDDG